MGSSTKSISRILWETGFYPFNGVAIWEEKYAIKISHKKLFFDFLWKFMKKLVESPNEKVKIYSKDSSNKEKT